jgi:mannose-1-phosphate guanylyltransferase
VRPTTLIPIVLCGGSGTRPWPLSRASHPKQFLDLVGGEGEGDGGGSLLARTLRRLAPLGPPRVVAVAGTEALAAAAVEEAGVATAGSLFEPTGKNTAPAVALACHLLLAEGRDEEVVGVFRADHLVADPAALRAAVALAARCARDGRVVTLGIRPTRPATGLGYIESGDEVLATAEIEAEGAAGASRGEPLAALAARGFREKPDRATAERFLAGGGFWWNAGMFVFAAAAMAERFERHMPVLWERVRTVEPDLSNLDAVYAAIGPESLDYGVMERLDQFAVVPCDPGLERPRLVGRGGSFEILRDTERFKSKILRVSPGHRLSSQSHRRRSEHWVVVAGRPRLILDGEARDLAAGDHAFIPAGAPARTRRHRVRPSGSASRCSTRRVPVRYRIAAKVGMEALPWFDEHGTWRN